MLTRLRNQLHSLRASATSHNEIERLHDFDQYDHTILLLNGIFQTRTIWQVMEQRLRREGYGVLSLNLDGVFQDHRRPTLEHQALWLSRKVDRLFVKYDLQQLHIIGHSSGGLIARHLIQQYDDDRRVQSLCTLSTAHHGTPVGLMGAMMMGTGLSKFHLSSLPFSRLTRSIQSEPLPSDIPVTSIYSANDWLTPWWTSVLRKGPSDTNIHNVRVSNVGHSEMTVDPQVFNEVLEHLRRVTTPPAQPYKSMPSD